MAGKWFYQNISIVSFIRISSETRRVLYSLTYTLQRTAVHTKENTKLATSIVACEGR